MTDSPIEREISSALQARGIKPTAIDVRAYPGEINVVVSVAESEYESALGVAEEIESELAANQTLLLIIRREKPSELREAPTAVRGGVKSAAASELVSLISSRNRVSDVQPSLSYVRDVSSHVTRITTQRHHLVFGRRGAGKSTLMVEAKRLVEQERGVTVWINLQTLRRDETKRIFLRIVREMAEALIARLTEERLAARPLVELNALYDRLSVLIGKDDLTDADATRLLPEAQRAVKRALELLGVELYVFVDDFYYVSRQEQPELLDMLHGVVRDARAWLKVASIRHLTRWFTSNPPRGLQTGQDADIIDLDVTLEDPLKAREFLTDILSRYAAAVGIKNLSGVFRPESLNRLVLASGGVPRDFLVLAASAIVKAGERDKARLVGVQDINQVAGAAADAKIQELEEDLAANVGASGRALGALRAIREFCLTSKSTTFFAVDFMDKENLPKEYAVFTDLQDLRLVHLIHRAVSSAHEAGHKSEVFILDLSQYTGSRLKQGLQVFDLTEDSIVLRTTRSQEKDRTARTSRQVLTLLRTAPVLPLETFSALAEG